MESRAQVEIDRIATGAALHLRWGDGVRLGTDTDECDRAESGGSPGPSRLLGRGRRSWGLSLKPGTERACGQQ